MRVGEGPRQDFLAGVCLKDARRPDTVDVDRGSFNDKFKADRRFNFKKDDVVFFRRNTHLAYPARSRRK